MLIGIFRQFIGLALTSLWRARGSAWALFLALGLLGSGASAARPFAGDVIREQAYGQFTGANGVQHMVYSNSVEAVVQMVEALALSGEQSREGVARDTRVFRQILKNVGNGVSSYRFEHDSIGCAAVLPFVRSPRLYQDQNSNGVVDSADREIAWSQDAQLQLMPGAAVDLLFQVRIPPSLTEAHYCERLLVVTQATSQQVQSLNRVRIGPMATLRVSSAVELTGSRGSGVGVLRHRVDARNVGRVVVSPTSQLPNGRIIRVDGSPRSLLLLRAPVHSDLEYQRDSLYSEDPDAVLLHRLAGDAQYSYRTGVPDLQGTVVEVAIGLTREVFVDQAFQFGFSTRVRSRNIATVSSVAEAVFYNGARVEAITSNVATVRTLDPLGLSLAASTPYANVDASGKPDGTATVRFHLLARNYHSAALHSLRIVNPLEHIPSGLGRYSAAPIPEPGTYTVVSDSLRIVALHGATTVAEVEPGFTGQQGHAQLLSSAATLGPGGSVALQFDVRFHLAGLPAQIYNSAVAHAMNASNAVVLSVPSVNGLDPDAVALGGPQMPSQATPYSARPPVVSLQSEIAAPRLVAGTTDTYDLDFSLRLRNEGPVDVAYLRLVENLDCTFGMDADWGRVQSWKLLTEVVSEQKLLTPAPAFTGQGACENKGADGIAPVAAIPLQLDVALVDGPVALPVGREDALHFTVRVTMKAAAPEASTWFTRRSWVAVLQPLAQTAQDRLPNRNDGQVEVLWATLANATQVRTMPTGVVYNALTRLPVANARVLMTRQSCQSTPVQGIVAADLAGDTSSHTFHGDGRVSMLTDGSGQYHFVLHPQTAQDLCTYSLQVEPPPDSNLRYPSKQILAQAGAFNGCGAVAAVPSAPQQGQDMRYFDQLVLGSAPGSSAVCNAFYNHIPLDPSGSQGLRLQKQSDVRTAELGDVLRYTLTLANDTAQDLSPVLVDDLLPAGFHYVPGSALLQGQRQPDPQGGLGPHLVFSIPSLDAGASTTLNYQVRIGLGASIDKDAVNRAWASTGVAPTQLRSNEAAALVHVLGGVFSDDAFAFGKVFLDCNHNGLHDAAELGIPGVHLLMEDGVGVVTDSEGKWSLYGLRPLTHVLHLDTQTLPAGAVLARVGNRQGQQNDSVFMDLQRGAWHKANFAVLGCELPHLRQEVEARREVLRNQPGMPEDGARAAVRLTLEAERANRVPARHGPAAGTVESQGVKPALLAPSSALISLQPSDAGSAAVLPDAAASPALDRTVRQVIVVAPEAAHPDTALPLEDSIQNMDAELAFLNLRDQQVLPGSLANVRVKGRADARFVLLLNGVAVDEVRVGKRVRMAGLQLEAWEYIAVQFQPGENTLQLQEHDPFGNLRAVQEIRLHATGALARLALDLEATAPADPNRPIQVGLRLLDGGQRPVLERTMVTLEAVGARWEVPDLNPQEPGVQTMVEGGSATLALIAPAQAGEGQIRVSAADLQTQADIIFLPDLRPLTGVGILEGIVRFNPANGIPLGAARAADAFESELRAWSHSSGTDTALAGRSAFYFKGAVKGEYLLTLAYDNEKRTAMRMFRDIQPDQYYPIYGDSSSKNFDAQSSQRLYLRIDKDRSYLLFGDHNTESSPEVRKLSQMAHNATGVKHVLNRQGLRISSYVSHDALQQYVEEFPANGTSGPFPLHTPGDLFANSEIVQVIVRDRNQPNTVLRSTALTRFAQYTIEPLSKTILFSAPVASLDADFNPQSIRITYAVDEGGASFWRGGVDLQYQLTQRVQLGGVVAYEGMPDKNLELTAATMLARVGSDALLRAEAVGTQSDLHGLGQGLRLHLEDSVGALKYDMRLHSSDAGFHNPYSGIPAGQTDLAYRADYALNDSTRIKTDLAYSQADGVGVRTQGAGVGLQNVLTPYVTSEVGLRVGRSGLGSVGSFDYASVSSVAGLAPAASGLAGLPSEDYVSARGRLTFKPPALPQMQLFVEAEQDVNDASRQLSALGGNYALSPQTRIYGRYELISSAGNADALAPGLQRNIGLVYDELRMADTMDGRALQSAMGIRNSWAVGDGLRLSGGLEQVSAVPGSVGTIAGASRAWTGAYDWLGQGDYLRRLRASGSAEWREGSDSHSQLLSSGLAYKWNQDWSVLARGIFSRVQQQSDRAVHDKRRTQIGLAYRPVHQDVWNALWRYEHKVDQRHGAHGSATPAAHAVTDVLSSHLHYQALARHHVSTRLAVRSRRDVLDALPSRYLAGLWHGRWTHDLNAVWDLGLQAGLWGDDRGVTRHTLGTEVGYQLGSGIWLSVGYNLLGLNDPDLSGADYTDAGLYLRLRFKFDERLFISGADTGASGGGVN